MIRKISAKEAKLVRKILARNNFLFPSKLCDMIVESLDDGGMGSLRFLHSNQKFNQSLIPYVFKDTDGVDVSATINLDTNGEVYELDLWKVNFQPLKINLQNEEGKNNV